MTVLVALGAALLAGPWAGATPEVTGGVVVVAVVAWWFFAAVFWPFLPCLAPFCSEGKVRRPGKSKAWRRCSWCKGAGSRLTFGRRVYERYRRKARR